MSAVIVLTPMVVCAWPAIASAIMGAAASMGFSLRGSALHEEKESRLRKVERDIEQSEVVADQLNPGEKIVVTRDDLTVEFGQDRRGRCTVCVSGLRHSEKELKRIGDEIAGRVVQQFAYHKLVTELKHRNYSVVEEEVLADQSVRLRIRG